MSVKDKRCKNCKHYSADMRWCAMVISDVSEPDPLDMTIGLEQYFVVGGNARVHVGPEFGCIHFKESP